MIQDTHSHLMIKSILSMEKRKSKFEEYGVESEIGKREGSKGSKSDIDQRLNRRNSKTKRRNFQLRKLLSIGRRSSSTIAEDRDEEECRLLGNHDDHRSNNRMELMDIREEKRTEISSIGSNTSENSCLLLNIALSLREGREESFAIETKFNKISRIECDTFVKEGKEETNTKPDFISNSSLVLLTSTEDVEYQESISDKSCLRNFRLQELDCVPLEHQGKSSQEKLNYIENCSKISQDSEGIEAQLKTKKSVLESVGHSQDENKNYSFTASRISSDGGRLTPKGKLAKHSPATTEFFENKNVLDDHKQLKCMDYLKKLSYSHQTNKNEEFSSSASKKSCLLQNIHLSVQGGREESFAVETKFKNEDN